MKHILLSLLICSFALGHAQTEVSPYHPGVTKEGVTYFLPKTGIHVTVTARRKSYKPGEYSRYAERYLRLKNVTQQPYDEWEILKLDITTYGSADPSQAYTIKVKTKTSAPLVGLAPDGRLLSVNTVMPALPQLSRPSVVKDKAPTLNPADYKTGEILAAGSTSKMAELTANEIYDIRENRSMLTKGQADFMPQDGEQLRLMLKQLDTNEEALLQLFKGTVTTETHVFTFDLIPDGNVENALLFRFSKHFGLVDNDDLSGTPFYITVEDMHTLPSEDPTAQKSKNDKEDLRYIVPGKATIHLMRDNHEIASQVVTMAQLGRVEHLGGDLFNKKYTTSVVLSPETGAIVKINAEEPQ